MSLFGSIQLANNTLRATQIGLQVVGQNIANASTPGYSREEVVLTPAPMQRNGAILLGLGVKVEGVVQKIDRFLEERLRGASSDRAGAEVQQQTFLSLESLVNELSDTDLSTLLTNLFSSIQEVANHPEDLGIRDLVMRDGQTLTQHIQQLSGRARGQRSDLNEQVIRAVDDINRLTEEIRTLNVRIAKAEGGDTSGSDAVGLRDQRSLAMSELAELIDIKVSEQVSGGVAVFAGGEFLVFEGRRRAVKFALEPDRGLSVAEVRIAETNSPLLISAGRVGGLVTARDEILGGFLERLDDLAGTLAFEFNKVHAAGQGLAGYDKVTSEFGVDRTDSALDDAGLVYSPVSGSFQVLVRNRETDQVTTHDIFVKLDGLQGDTTLDSLAAGLDAVDGIDASIDTQGKLVISSQSPEIEFSFSGDTSGALAALGVNTFFSGSTALDLDVAQPMVEDPRKFAASSGGIGIDEKNALELGAFLDKPLASKNDASLLVLYNNMTAEIAQGSTVAGSIAEGFGVFEETLVGQQMAISGVNLDEEAVQLITLQRTYQASARYIATLSDLLNVLVNL